MSSNDLLHLFPSVYHSRSARLPGRRPAKLAFPALLAVLLGAPLLAQTPESAEPAELAPRPVRLWVEVTDDRGQPPAGLAAGELEVIEDGSVLEPLAVRPLGRQDVRVVLYFDLALSRGSTVRRAAEALATHAGLLTGRGEVELVTAGESAESVLSTDDELLLSERLNWTAINDPGEGRQLRIRAGVLDELRRLAVLGNAKPEELARIVLDGIREEQLLIRERQEMLATALANRPQDGPRLAFVVSDGFDLDPMDFYGGVLEEDVLRLVAQRFMEMQAEDGSLADELARTAHALGALGWTVVPFMPEGGAADEEVRGSMLESDTATGRSTGVGVTIRPGSIFKRRREAAEREAAEARGEAARLVDPALYFNQLADATGGQRVTHQSAVEDFLQRFARRYELFYPSTLGGDAGTVPLEVRGLSRAGQASNLRVRGPRFVSPGVPPEITALRLRQVLRGRPTPDGSLDVAAVLEVFPPLGPPEGTVPGGAGAVEARLQLRDLYDEVKPADVSYRVTVGASVNAPDGGTDFEVLSRELRTGEDMRGLTEWSYRTSVKFDEGKDFNDLAVLVEDVASGRWGAARAAVTSRLAGVDAEEGGLIQAPVIEIVRPDEDLLRGKVRFETRIFDRRVARVVFQLNDKDVAEAESSPFAAKVDLGRSPRRQTLAAVAFDAEDQELGRDTVVLNAGSGGLSVEILKPSENVGTGPVDFEASVAVPVERQLDRVIFFWNNETLSTLYAPPFRQRVVIPEEAPVGYVRVVAMLDDGTVAEDVFFVNSPGQAGERVEVNLVELYVVVTDEHHRPVRGLTEDDFMVREEGRLQQIASFSAAADLPLTLGMAIDSSASMFVKLPNVQRAAIDFLQSTFSDQDRAFVVDFDTTPRLVRSTTHEMDRVVRSIERLEANGRTALWESIVYSLVQLQGVRGRKALVVFSDGADEDDDFPFRSCFNFSKKMGVPIYLILMRKEPQDLGSLPLGVRSFMSKADRLVAATGGRVFYARDYDSLDAVYDEIEIELRSQYLLTYYPNVERGTSWRDVDVTVMKKGLLPRTLSGYWP